MHYIGYGFAFIVIMAGAIIILIALIPFLKSILTSLKDSWKNATIE